MLISASRLAMLYICAKFYEIISKGIKVIERTRFLYLKLQRGIIPQKIDGVIVVNRCKSGNYLERHQSYRADTISMMKRTKGTSNAKNVGGVTVPNLCTSSGHALYFYQVL